MTKQTITAILAALSLGTAPALAAQDMQHGQHDQHAKHGDHDHDHDHADEAPLEAEGPIAPVATRTITATVDGMVCDFCARSLTKVLRRKDAVADVAIDLTAKTVTIVLAEGAAMTDEEVEEAVLSAGYNLAHLERS